jgi:hypothetical protein
LIERISMNEALTIPQPPSIGAMVSELFAFIGLPSERAAKQGLAQRADELVATIATILDQLVLDVIEKRTASEFKAAREAAFPNYVRAMRGVSDLVRAVVPTSVLDRLTSESFCELEADFRDHGLSSFGAAIRDQAIFTIWTLRKISDLLERVSAKRLADHLIQADAEFASQFAFFSLWTRFHLDCLTVSMKLQKPLYPDVLELITDGLRAAVNAYAWIRQGVDLRIPVPEPTVAPIEWDDEDQELLDSSMQDMDHEPY